MTFYGNPALPLDVAGPLFGEVAGGIGLAILLVLLAVVVAVVRILRVYRKNKAGKDKKR